MEYPKYVARIIDSLESEGYEAYIVGGSVRDMLLKKEPNDYDVTTSALPEETLRIFSDMRTVPTGLKHGTVTVLSDGHPIEVTTFRIDGEYVDCRRPEKVSFTENVGADLSRRDFTVNAMAYSKKRGLIDLFCGKQDIQRRVIRAVGYPKLRFSEDALRILRAFRFSAQLDFEIEKETLDAAKEMRDGLSHIAAERISAEFIRTICSNTPITPLKLMSERGILEFILGDYAPSDTQIEALTRAKTDAATRFGILLSGLEKDRLQNILHSLKLSNKLTSDITRLALAVSEYLEGDAADARRFVGRFGDIAPLVLDAASALRRIDTEFYNFASEAIEKKSCVSGDSLAVNGYDIVKLGVKGREVGDLLSYLLECVIEDPKLNEKETLLSIAREKLKNNGECNG